MRAILVDPARRTVERLYDEFQNSFIVMHHLGTTVLTTIPLGPVHIGLLDEFGPFRKAQSWFGMSAHPELAIAGRMLVVQRPAEEGGLFGPCQLDVDAVTKVLRWFDDPREAEALVPPTQIGHYKGKRAIIDQEILVSGFRSMDKQFVGRDGKVSEYDPA